MRDSKPVRIKRAVLEKPLYKLHRANLRRAKLGKPKIYMSDFVRVAAKKVAIIDLVDA